MSKLNIKSHRICEICGIQEARQSIPRFFATFPLDEVRCREWVQVTGKEDLVYVPIEKLHRNRYVCGDHFTKKDFNRKGNRLKIQAVPSLNLVSVPLNDSQLSGFPLYVFKRQDCLLENRPSTSKENYLAEMVTADVTCTTSDQGVCETSLGRSAIQEQDNNIKRPLSEIQEIAAPSAKKPCIAMATESKTEDPGELTPRKKLVEQLAATQYTLKPLKSSAMLLEKINSPVLREFVINACRNDAKHPKGRRWSTQHKISCLAIFKRSPRAYLYLSTAITLPSEKTLKNIFKKIPMQSGINQFVLKHLKKIAPGKDENEKLCCLTFDEMAIKPRLIYNETADVVEGFEDLGDLGRSIELADHALVFMLQGLGKKFKQPLAFYFTKSTISSAKLAMIIKDIIRAVTSCGYTIVNTVCDQAPTNIEGLKLLREASGPSSDGSNHYFKVDGKTIFVIYDIPHLFKSIRNNFLKCGKIILDGKVGLWQNLVEMELANRVEIYYTKINETHVNPKYRSKMKVNIAAQLFSYSVHSFLKLLVRETQGQKRTDYYNTAHVIFMLDRLFDLTNGPAGPHDIKKNLRVNVSEKSNHLEQWAHFIKILSNTKFINKNGTEAKNIKCINGYITSLKSMRDIWKLVHASDFEYLNLRNLNQDALENLFGLIRQHSPTNRHPTVSHFVAAIKTSVITRLTGPHSRGSNCQRDNKSLLTDFHDIVFEKDEILPEGVDTIPQETAEGNISLSQPLFADKDITEAVTIENFPIIEFPEEDNVEEDFSLLSEQSVVYVAGYIASRVLTKSNCKNCKNDLIVENPKDNPIYYAYILLREWWQEKFSLTYPSLKFCNIIKILVNTTKNDLLPHIHEPNVRELACTMYAVNLINFSFSCLEHGNDIQNVCFQITSKLLIRRHCQIINRNIAAKEEALESLYKRAEQQGTSK